MQHARKKAAVAKYGPMLSEGKTEEEIKAAMAADEKNYTEEEQDEVWITIVDNAAGGVETGSEATPAGNGYIVCEEWRMDFSVHGQPPVKTRMLRDNVKLTPEVFENMNGKTSPDCPIQYFQK